MTGFFLRWTEETWALLGEAAPWLVFGFIVAGVVHVLVPVAKVTRHLGAPGVASIIKAALIGMPLPLCSCSVIPLSSTLRKQGASRGAYTSFLISTPETGVDSMAISYALLGPLLTIVRPLVAFVTAVVAGLAMEAGTGAKEVREDAADTAPEGSGCCSGGCSMEAKETPGVLRRTGTALHYGLIEMMTDLAPWLITGFLLAGLVGVWIPDGFLERYVGSGLPAMLLMLAVGLPMYVCSTSSTPVAAALIARGLSPGAALVFLMAGPATNLATMSVVVRELGRRGLVIYLACIALVAVVFGLLTDWVLTIWPTASRGLESHDNHDHAVTGSVFAVILVILMFNGLFVRWKRRFGGSPK